MAPRSDPQVALGQAIRQTRLARGLSQEQVAHGADLHPTWISHIEGGSNPAWAPSGGSPSLLGSRCPSWRSSRRTSMTISYLQPIEGRGTTYEETLGGGPSLRARRRAIARIASTKGESSSFVSVGN